MVVLGPNPENLHSCEWFYWRQWVCSWEWGLLLTVLVSRFRIKMANLIKCWEACTSRRKSLQEDPIAIYWVQLLAASPQTCCVDFIPLKFWNIFLSYNVSFYFIWIFFMKMFFVVKLFWEKNLPFSVRFYTHFFTSLAKFVCPMEIHLYLVSVAAIALFKDDLYHTSLIGLAVT